MASRTAWLKLEREWFITVTSNRPRRHQLHFRRDILADRGAKGRDRIEPGQRSAMLARIAEF